jgi:hypothetical protein
MGKVSLGSPDLLHITRLDEAEGFSCLRREGLHMYREKR